MFADLLQKATIQNINFCNTFHAFSMILLNSHFSYFNPLGTNFGPIFIKSGQSSLPKWSPRHQFASPGPLLGPSRDPFWPPWCHLGVPWLPFLGALAPLGSIFGDLGPPRPLPGGIFHKSSSKLQYLPHENHFFHKNVRQLHTLEQECAFYLGLNI